MTTRTQFNVLGPVSVWRDGCELDVGHPKQRAVLAVLLLRDGAQVQFEELVDAVWGDTPPRSARNILRSYVCRLRQTLADGSAEPLPSRPGGYALVHAPETLDLRRFQQLVDLAATARREGDPALAAARLRTGLALWRGVPLAGVPGPHAENQRRALGELRVAAVEELLACDLDQGSHAKVAAEASALAAEHPLRERLRELQMTALYGAGRQAEALAVFDTTRRLLRDELGVDPSAGLQQVYQRVLTADPQLGRPTGRERTPATAPAGPAPAASTTMPSPPPAAGTTDPDPDPAPAPSPHGTPAPVVRPAQLPSDLIDFVGRCAQAEEVIALGTVTDGAPSPPIVIAGMAGIGKTTLAIRCAHRLAPHFPDGQLHVNLRGFDASGRPLDPHTVLGTFLRALGIPLGDIPSTTDDRAALYRSLLAGRRILVLLDNARDPAQVRPLLPGTPGCLTLITSRCQLAGLVASHGARSLRLPMFDSAEGADFVLRRLGRLRVEAEPEALTEIVRLCVGLPVALAITCASAAMRPTVPLSAIAAELRLAHGSLEAFSVEEADVAADVRAVFSWSYDALGPEAARLFRLLAVHGGPEVTVGSAMGVTGLPERRVRRILNELSRSHLLTEDAPGHYVWHDLLRAYATELLDACEEAS